MKNLTVNVTKEVIAIAKAKTANACMIAMAISSYVPNAKCVRVDLEHIKFTDPVTRKRYTFPTPLNAQKRILAFDQGIDNKKPFTVQLTNALVDPIPERRKKVKVIRTKQSYLKKRPNRSRAQIAADAAKVPPLIHNRRAFGLRIADQWRHNEVE